MTIERDLYRKFVNENKKPKYQVGAKIKDPDGTTGTIKEVVQGVNGNFYYKVDLGSSYGLDMLKETEIRLMPAKDPKVEATSNETHTLVFDIDFSSPDAKTKIEQFRTEGIKAFKEFLVSGKEGFLGYTVRRVDSRYQNDYIFYADILYNFGFYENEYHISGKDYYNRPQSGVKILEKKSKNVKTIEKYIEFLFNTISEECLNIAKANQNESSELNYKEFTDEITSYLKEKGFQLKKSFGNNKEFLKKGKQEPCYVHIIKDPDQKKVVMYYETPRKGEKALTSFSMSNTKEKAIQLAKSALERKLGQKLNESIESDFNTEVARRKFNELCKRIGSALANDNVKWVEQDPGNFDAWIEALTFLRTAMGANKDSAFIDAINNAEYALDKDGD